MTRAVFTSTLGNVYFDKCLHGRQCDTLVFESRHNAHMYPKTIHLCDVNNDFIFVPRDTNIIYTLNGLISLVRGNFDYDFSDKGQRNLKLKDEKNQTKEIDKEKVMQDSFADRCLHFVSVTLRHIKAFKLCVDFSHDAMDLTFI